MRPVIRRQKKLQGYRGLWCLATSAVEMLENSYITATWCGLLQACTSLYARGYL